MSYLRSLVDAGIYQLCTFKHPDTVLLKGVLNEVLIAAGLGGISKDSLDSLYFEDGFLLIESSYGSHGRLERADRKELPECIIDADDPILAAKIWGCDMRIKRNRRRIAQAKQDIEGMEENLERAIVERLALDPTYKGTE